MTSDAADAMRAASPGAQAPSPQVHGATVDDQTRCAHYHAELDVIALKFRCCGDYYPCFECHEESAGHAIERWAAEERGERAVLCGVCRHELAIDEYLDTGSCPRCAAPFNPRCGLHHDLYFGFPKPVAPAQQAGTGVVA